LAAAATAVLVMHGGGHAPVEVRAQIEASTAADFERTVTHGPNGTDEIVRLRAGRISLAVADGDHVRVAARNGEIEGSGLYEVAVARDAIEEVTVREGSARVRITGAREVFLATGQVWRAPVTTADLITTPAPPQVAKPSLASQKPTPTTLPHAERVTSAPVIPEIQPVTAPPLPVAPEQKPSTNGELEKHFTAGWALLQQNKPDEAARELETAARVGGDDPLAGDARYFEAVALTKAGRKTEAEHALVAFLDRSPRALRRGRAAVMLARLIAERGDVAGARTWFESAERDSDPAVEQAAKSGLAALH
ncbi:MAG TPA: tetratricopeptide repeat protein, partial [Kofleriaceae bacterium]